MLTRYFLVLLSFTRFINKVKSSWTKLHRVKTLKSEMLAVVHKTELLFRIKTYCLLFIYF